MRHLRITIGNKSYEVIVEDLSETEHYHAPPAHQPLHSQAENSSSANVEQRVPVSRPQLTAGMIASPMAGTIISISIKPGDRVSKGQDLLVLEAMKMENHIKASDNATVRSVEVKQGQTVREGEILVILD